MLSTHANFEAVFRIGSDNDIAAVNDAVSTVSKAYRILLWIDFIGDETFQSSVVSAVEAIDNRLIHVSCIVTSQNEDSHKLAKELAERLCGFRELKLDAPTGIPGVKAASLHDDIKLSSNINLLALGPEKLRGVVEKLIGDRPIAVLYHDDTPDGFVCFVRIHISDVGYLHKLRDDILIGKFEQVLRSELRRVVDDDALEICVDKSHFAERYEVSILSLNTLTPHQTEKLADCRKAGERPIHVRAPAGAGKTFIALHLMYALMQQGNADRVLFVAPKLALALFVTKWLCKRLDEENQGGSSKQTVLQHFFVMAKPSDAKSLVLYHVRLDDSHIVHTPFQGDDEVPTFSMIVVDESHHLYRDKEHREIIERHVAKGAAQRVLLSDVSQSRGNEVGFPSDEDLIHVELTEVVRSSKRIVAGAMAFQLGRENNPTKCHHESDGPPLRTFLFDVQGELHETYANYTLRALTHVTTEFPDLDLDDRLAIIVPDTRFQEAIRPLLLGRLASQFPQRRLVLVSAEDASAALSTRRHGERHGVERIVLSTIDQFIGLERLIVISVGLDTTIDDEDNDVLETRSRLYQTITRAHMMARRVLDSHKNSVDSRP
jgi:hypothetical protein